MLRKDHSSYRDTKTIINQFKKKQNGHKKEFDRFIKTLNNFFFKIIETKEQIENKKEKEIVNKKIEQGKKTKIGKTNNYEKIKYHLNYKKTCS